MIRGDRFPATKAWGKLPLPMDSSKQWWEEMFSELNAKRCSGLVSHTIGQMVKLPQWWWESEVGGRARWTSTLGGWTGGGRQYLQSVLAVSTCKSVFVSQYLHCAVQTIYLQIATAGDQQLFGRVGGANINYLKQQICVSNTFAQSTKSSIIFDWISSGGESGNWWTISSFLLSIML